LLLLGAGLNLLTGALHAIILQLLILPALTMRLLLANVLIAVMVKNILKVLLTELKLRRTFKVSYSLLLATM